MAARKPSIQNKFIERIKRISVKCRIPLATTQLDIENEVYTKSDIKTELCEYDINDETVDAFELLCIFTNEVRNAASLYYKAKKFKYSTRVHFLPILESAIYTPLEGGAIVLAIRSPVGLLQQPIVNNLDHTIRNGLRISNRHIVKWMMHILSSLIFAHDNFMTIGHIDTGCILLLTDEVVGNSYRHQYERYRNKTLTRLTSRAHKSAEDITLSRSASMPTQDTPDSPLASPAGSPVTKRKTVINSSDEESAPVSPLRSELSTRKLSNMGSPLQRLIHQESVSSLRKGSTSSLFSEAQSPVSGTTDFVYDANSTLYKHPHRRDAWIALPMFRTLPEHTLHCHSFELLRQHLDKSTSVCKIREDDPNADKIFKKFTEFCYHAYRDLHCLGCILLEVYLRRKLTPTEQIRVNKAENVEGIYHLFELGRLSGGLRKLLKLCFDPMPDYTKLRYSDDANVVFVELRSVILSHMRTIYGHLKTEYRMMGSYTEDMNREVSRIVWWTKEDEAKRQAEKALRKEELAEKAELGQRLAAARSLERKKKIWFSMLPEATQKKILHKIAARKLAMKHRDERNHLDLNEFESWIYSAIFAELRSNYFVKKSGVRMTLSQKHSYDRTVAIVEYVEKKLLTLKEKEAVQHDEADEVSRVSAMIDADASLSTTKDSALNASAERRGSTLGDTNRRGSTAAPADNRRGSTAAPADNRRGSTIDSPDNRRGSTIVNATIASVSDSKKDNQSADDESASMELEEVDGRFAAEQRKLQLYSFFSRKVAYLLVSSNTAAVIAGQIRQAKSLAKDMMDKSPMASLLPTDQYAEKLLLSTVDIMATKFTGLQEIAVQFLQLIRLREKSYEMKFCKCVCVSLISKYDEEARQREKGEGIAAAKLQAIARGMRVRYLVALVWEQAGEQYAREEARAREAFAEPEIDAQSTGSKSSTVSTSIKKQPTFIDRFRTSKAYSIEESVRADADLLSTAVTMAETETAWARVQLAEELRNGCVMEVCLCPTYDMRLQSPAIMENVANDFRLKLKKLKPTLSVTKEALKCQEVESTEESFKEKLGEVDILLDDSRKGIEGVTQSKTARVSIEWIDDYNERKRSTDPFLKYGVRFRLKITGLLCHSFYRIKLLIASHYKPRNDTKGINLTGTVHNIRLCFATLFTLSSPPEPPINLKADLLHFDRRGDSVANSLTESVVDKLQKLSTTLKATRTLTPSQRNSLTSDVAADVMDRARTAYRVVACRISWDSGECNGIAVSQYVVQRLDDDLSETELRKNKNWKTITTTSTAFFTDTIAETDQSVLPNEVAYRVKGWNDCGWSDYSEALVVVLQEKSLMPDQLQRVQQNLITRLHAESVEREDNVMSKYANMLTPSRNSRTQNLLDDAAIGGDSLSHTESTSMQQWLCKLSDACPLEQPKDTSEFHRSSGINVIAKLEAMEKSTRGQKLKSASTVSRNKKKKKGDVGVFLSSSISLSSMCK